VIVTEQNCDDPMTGLHNAHFTNGTPVTILLPNLDRQFEHVEAYRVTHRTPRRRDVRAHSGNQPAR
jgi:chorismate synthase